MSKDRVRRFDPRRRIDRMEKPEPGIFDTGTMTPRRPGTTIAIGWNPDEED
jgi:hypothetical protein